MTFNPLILTLLGLVLALVELVLGVQAGFDLVLIGSILILGGLIGSATGSIYVSLGVCAVLGLVYIIFGRNLIKEKIFIATHKTNIDKLDGQKGVVVHTITPDTAGMVRVDDEDWRATSDEVLYDKEKIKVVGLEGVTLKVKKAV